MKYKSLVLSGGSIKTISFIGSLQYIIENGIMSHIENFSGVSSGAIIIYLYLIGYSPSDIIYDMLRYGLNHSLHESFSVYRFIVGIQNNKIEGLYNFNIIYDYLKACTISKFGKIITFKELYEVNKKFLSISSYNISKNKIQYFSHELSPDMKCIDAIKLSCSIPFVFEKSVYNGDEYIDCACIEKLPITPVHESSVLGFMVVYNKQNSQDNVVEDEMEENSLYSYIRKLVSIRVDKTEYNCDIVCVRNNIHMIQFDIDQSKIMDLYATGYKLTKKYFE